MQIRTNILNDKVMFYARLFSLLILSFAFTTSCSNKVENQAKFEQTKLQETPEIEENINLTQKEFKTLRINADLEINSPDRSLTVNTDIKFAQKDTLSIVVNGPFGLTLAKSFITQDTALVYSVMENVTYVGSPNDDLLNKHINLPLSFHSLVNILLSEVPNNTGDNTDNFVFYNKKEIGGVSGVGNTIYRRINSGKGVEYIVINKENNEIRQYQFINIDGKTVLNVLYSDYQQTESGPYAKKIEIVAPEQKSKIVIKLNEINTNPNFEFPLAIKPPKSSKIILFN